MRLSVVTRTFRRPLLLERAARSVAAAKVAQMEWIIVDDDETVAAETEKIASKVREAGGIEVRTICSARGGRTAAANLGLSAAEGDFIHFHDDDDTVEPEFYRRLLGFLDEHSRYDAARAMCRRVYEDISGGTIRVLKERRVYPERRTVSLLDAAEVFAYPPIGSVFNRQMLLDIGGFDDSFEVGEDYEMLLRFLLKAEMGTVPECLASVHVRQKTNGVYANSPMESRFAEEDRMFLNALLRRDIEAGRFGFGFLLAFGRMSRKSRTMFDFLNTARKRIGL